MGVSTRAIQEMQVASQQRLKKFKECKPVDTERATYGKVPCPCWSLFYSIRKVDGIGDGVSGSPRPGSGASMRRSNPADHALGLGAPVARVDVGVLDAARLLAVRHHETKLLLRRDGRHGRRRARLVGRVLLALLLTLHPPRLLAHP